MSMGESIRTVFRKYADFSGVASLPEFWWWTLFTVLVSAALSVFSAFPAGESNVGAVLSGLWTVAVLLPGLAVTVRRLRDAGYWWTNVFWILVPIAGIIVLVIYLVKPSTTTAVAAA